MGAISLALDSCFHYSISAPHSLISAISSCFLLCPSSQLRQLSSFWLSLPPTALCVRALLGPFSLLGDRQASFYTAVQNLRAHRWGCWRPGCFRAWMPGCLDAWMPGCQDGLCTSLCCPLKVICAMQCSRAVQASRVPMGCLSVWPQVS